MNNRENVMNAYRDSISITHRHVLAVINSMLANEAVFEGRDTIRIMDAGCGNGKLLFFLHKYLPVFNAGKKFLLYGYDVIDHGVQEVGYVKKTFSYLYENAPDIDWEQRIKIINSDDNWPFENGSFDFVVSNQVLEHVWDYDHFFKENNRVQAEKGFSIHIFPVREVLWDGHAFLPKIHKLNSWDAIYRKVKFYSRLGIGIYRSQKKDYNYDVDQFSRVWADKIYHYCNYQYYADLVKSTKKNHLCITTRFTASFYWRKIKEVLGMKPDLYYKYKASSKIKFFFLKYLSGISIVLYKGEYSSYSKK